MILSISLVIEKSKLPIGESGCGALGNSSMVTKRNISYPSALKRRIQHKSSIMQRSIVIKRLLNVLWAALMAITIPIAKNQK